MNPHDKLGRENRKVSDIQPRRIALLVNPKTTTGPRDIAVIHSIAAHLRAVDFAMTSPEDPGGASMLDRWFRLGIRAIAVIGGDGTLRSVLTAVHEAGLSRDFDIVLLDGGSFGLAARMFGAKDAWRRVLDARTSSQPVHFDSLRLPTLMTERGIGFLVSAGAGAAVSRDFQSAQRKGSQLLRYVATRALETILGGESIALLDGYRGTVRYDEELEPGERWIALFVTSLPQFERGSGAKGQHHGQLYSLAVRFDGDPRMSPRLIDLFAGRWAGSTRVSREVQFASAAPFDVLLDGDIQRVGEGLAVRPGPTFRAWIPRTIGAPGLMSWEPTPFGQLLGPERILTWGAQAAGQFRTAESG